MLPWRGAHTRRAPWPRMRCSAPCSASAARGSARLQCDPTRGELAASRRTDCRRGARRCTTRSRGATRTSCARSWLQARTCTRRNGSTDEPRGMMRRPPCKRYYESASIRGSASWRAKCGLLRVTWATGSQRFLRLACLRLHASDPPIRWQRDALRAANPRTTVTARGQKYREPRTLAHAQAHACTEFALAPSTTV